MAGHSHWANIKHKKAANDAKRGKIWSKLVKAIMVAAKHGGPDPDGNIGLRFAIVEAKAANVPKDTIERAIKKGAGELGADSYEDIRYEGYGPGGVAVIADVLTDNRTRTAAEIRLIFGKHGGNLGASGSVAYMFEHQGVIAIEDGQASEERIMEIALEAGAADIAHEDGAWIITTGPTEFLGVKEAFDAAGVETASSELTFTPATVADVGEEDAQRVLKLIDALEDNDDVQKVYTNFEPKDD
ncbi:MAG: YebC/PmpR family DNA-binding transcriptional regulator [Phycisphaerales bacterium]|nr:MAG: YebC/PmpR family DNA-binding transcriptional regulator [Phycisphaerales bacterium]